MRTLLIVKRVDQFQFITTNKINIINSKEDKEGNECMNRNDFLKSLNYVSKCK